MQDLIFLEQLDFAIPLVDAHRCQYTTKSWGEAATAACALIGIELVDYNTSVFTPKAPIMEVSLRSKAWRERAERFGFVRPGPAYG